MAGFAGGSALGKAHSRLQANMARARLGVASRRQQQPLQRRGVHRERQGELQERLGMAQQRQGRSQQTQGESQRIGEGQHSSKEYLSYFGIGANGK